MTPHDAYIAGFVDGEGCIAVYPNGRKTSHVLSVQVVQAITPESTVLMEAMQKRFGGVLKEYASVGPSKKWNYLLQGEEAAAFLETLMPFLLLKKEQALVAVNWFRSRPPRVRGARGWFLPVQEEQQQIDREVGQRLRALKRTHILAEAA